MCNEEDWNKILAPLPQKFHSPRAALLLINALSSVGFSHKRQAKVRSTGRNLDRYRAFFGEDPIVHLALIDDLEQHYPNKFDVTSLLMTLNWFKGYDNQHVLAARWDKGENYVGRKVKEYTKKISSLLKHKIWFNFGDMTHRTFIATLDTVNFKTTEYRLDPSSKWYDQKSNSSGLVSETESISMKIAYSTPHIHSTHW